MTRCVYSTPEPEIPMRDYMADYTRLIDTPKLCLEYRVEGRILQLRPVGAIDEDINFSVVLELIGELGKTIQTVHFELGQIKSLNSCGVREWLLFIERLPGRLDTAFVDVNELFLEQANLISNLFGRKAGPVHSFQAPYHCDSCGEDVMLLLKPSHVKFEGELAQAPAAQCPKCGNALVFDSLEEEYFSFIRRAA
jgi:hypothetical protein